MNNLVTTKLYYWSDWWLNELVSIYDVCTYAYVKDASVVTVGSGNLLNISHQENLGRGKVKLVLPENRIMYREIILPENAASNIEKILDFEFNKYFPVSVHDVIYASTTRAMGNGKTSVQVWAVKREYLEHVLDEIEKENSVVIKQYSLVNAAGIEFLQAKRSRAAMARKASGNDTRNRLYRVLIPALIIVCLFIPVYKMQVYIDEAQQNTRSLEEKAGDLIKVKNEMLVIEEGLSEIIKRKNSSYKVTQIWAQLSDILENQAEVNRVTYKNNKIHIQGKARSVERIIKKFEANSMFSKISIDAPVRNIRNSNYETMNISLALNDEFK
jgi:hypothetical protein